MAQEKNAARKNKSDQQAVISRVRAEFAVLLAVITFVVGFVIGRGSEGISISPRNRELAIEPVGNPAASGQALTDQPSISDAEWVAELARQAEETPEDADAWTRLGNAYFDTEQPQAAIEAYQKSLDIEPDNPNVITDMGIMYRNIGNSQRAVELFERAARTDASHIWSRFNMGVVYLHDLQNPAKATAAWREVVALNPDFRSPTGQLVSDMVRALESTR